MKTPIALMVLVSAAFVGLAWLGVGLANKDRKSRLEEINQINHKEAVLATLPPAIKERLQLTEDKALLINVWATWCAPCIQEIPELNRLVEEFSDKNVAFLAVSDEMEGDFIEWQVKPKNQDFQYSYVLEFNNQPLMNYLRSIEYIREGKAIPQHFLINSDGKLTEVFVGGTEENVEKIRKFLEAI